jgi:hypothetical protein
MDIYSLRRYPMSSMASGWVQKKKAAAGAHVAEKPKLKSEVSYFYKMMENL